MQTPLDLVQTVGFYLIFPILVLTPAVIVVGLILHSTLIARLDPVLFKAPYFHEKELKSLMVWPLTMVKTLGYMMLIACPKLAKWKRFKGVGEALPVEKPLIALCYAELVMLVSLIVTSVLLLIASALSALLG